MIKAGEHATLDLKEAADFLGLHPCTLQQRAKAGLVPGAKLGRAWRFLEVDLVIYLRGQYDRERPTPRILCPSIGVPKSGGFVLSTKVNEYDAALALPTRKKRSKSMTR